MKDHIGNHRGKYNAAIIGCGKIAGVDHAPDRNDFIYSHAAGYYHHPKIKLTAACDPDSQRLAAFAAVWGVRSPYENAREMFAHEAPDLVSITSPTCCHVDHLKTALEEKIPVILCEKPLAANLKQALPLMKAAGNGSSKIVVNYFRRFNPALVELHRMIRSGELGKVCRITVIYNKGILHNGSHYIDCIRWMFDEFDTVEVVQQYHYDNLVDDHALDIFCRLKNGTPVTFLAADHNHYNILEMDILTDRGRIRLPNTTRRIDFFKARDDEYFPHLKFLHYSKIKMENPWQTVFSDIMDHLASLLECDAESRCSLQDGIQSLVVTDAIEHSLQHRTRVSVVDTGNSLFSENK